MKKTIISAMLLLASVGANAMSFDHAKNIYYRLAKANGLTPPPLVYSDSKDFNAMYDGSEIVVNRGMLNSINDDNQIALVLGHEMGHWQLHHQYSSIQHEYEADKYGYNMLKKGGFDKCDAREIFKKFPSPQSSDHPASKDRYNRLPC